jgi:hypothetical protein
VWTVARCLLLALNFLLLSSRPYLLATILVTLVNVALVVLWDRAAPDEHVARVRSPERATLLFALVGALIVFAACRAWLQQILIFPHDSQRADMLVVVQLGIRRLLNGGNPYTMYNMPWPAPLPYGIVMWAPMLVPHLLHADVRFATILGALFVPLNPAAVHAACAAALFSPVRSGTTRLELVQAVTVAVAVALSLPSATTSGLVAVTVFVAVCAVVNVTR